MEEETRPRARTVATPLLFLSSILARARTTPPLPSLSRAHALMCTLRWLAEGK